MATIKEFFKLTRIKIILALALLLPALLLGPSYQEIKSCKVIECGFLNNVYYQTTVFISGFLQISINFFYNLGIPKAHEIVLWMLIIALASGYYLVSCEVFLAYKRMANAGLVHRKYIGMIKNGVHYEKRIKYAGYKPLH